MIVDEEEENEVVKTQTVVYDDVTVI